MRRTVDKLATAGFVLALLVLGVNAWVSYHNTQQLVANEHAEARTHQALMELEGIRASVADAETGQRGYLLTGQEAFLKPYADSAAHIKERMARLEELTSDSTPEH